MAAAGGGFLLFSGQWRRLRAAAASAWRRRRVVPGGEEEEEAVRGRLERRAAAARRFGRRLVVASLNLEALVFIYAFWRARRRNLSWRNPVGALPLFVIPALATIIYTAFIRLTRILDLRDKKVLEGIQEEKQAKHVELKESCHNLQKNIEHLMQKYDDADLADNSVAATSTVTAVANLGKCPQLNNHVIGEFRADMSWDHSKDFQAVQSDGLRYRELLSGEKDMTSTFSQPIDRSCKQLANVPDYIAPNQRMTGRNGNFETEFEEHEVAYSITDRGRNPFLPGCSNSLMNSNDINSAESVSHSKSLEELGGDDAQGKTLTVLPELKGQEMSFISDEGDGKEMAPTEEVCSFGSSNGLSACHTDISNAYRVHNNLRPILSDLMANHLGVSEELPAESDEEKLFTATSNDGIGSSSNKEISTSPNDCNEECSQSSNSSPFLGSSVPSKMYSESPARDGNEEASAFSSRADMHEDTSTSFEGTSRSPSDCNHSRPVISSMATDVSTVTEELLEPPGHEKTPTSGEETPTFPIDFHECHDETNHPNCAESSLPSTIFQELLVKVDEEKSMTRLQPPENYVVSPAFIKEDPASLLDCSILDNGSNDLSFNASSLVLTASESFEALLAKGSKEEALVGSEEATRQQTNTFTSEEETLTSRCAFNKKLAIASAEKTTTSPSARDNDIPNSLSFVTVSHESSFPGFPELLGDGGEEKQSSMLHKPEELELSFSLEKKGSICPDDGNGAKHCLSNSGFSSCIRDFDTMKVTGGFRARLSESQDEKAFSFEEDIFSSSDDVTNAENFTQILKSAHFLPEANMTEALQVHEGVSFEPLHENIVCFERTSASPGRVNVAASSAITGEKNCTFDEETSISPDQVHSAEINNSMSAQCVPEENKVEGLQGSEKASSEPLHDTTFSLEETFISPDEGVSAGKNSLYSRSSSCVSEAIMKETLGDVQEASSEPEDENDFSFEEKTSMSPEEVRDAENHTSHSWCAECIPEANMMETLQCGEETPSSSLHDGTISFEKTLVCTDEGSSTESYSIHPPAPSFILEAKLIKSLRADREGFSKRQCENDFTCEETFMSPEQVNNAENCLTNSVSAQDITDFSKTMESPQDGERTSYESIHVNTFSLGDNSVDPDEVITAENYSDSPMSSLCIPEANLIEAPQGGQGGSSERREENILGLEDISISLEEINNAENHLSNPWSPLYIPNADTMEALQGGEKASSESLHDNAFSTELTSISPDEESYSNNSGSVFCIQEINMPKTLPGGHEESSKSGDDKAGASVETSILPDEVDNAKTNNEEHAPCIPEDKMMEIQDVEKASSESQHENSFKFKETSIHPDMGNNEENYSAHSRSSLYISEGNTIEAHQECHEGSSEPQDANAFSLKQTCTASEELRNAEDFSNNLRSVSYNLEISKKEDMGGTLKGSAEPLCERTPSFKETPIYQEEVYESLHEKALNSEETSVSHVEVNDAKNYLDNPRSSSCTSTLNRIEAPQSGEKEFFQSRQLGEPEVAIKPVMTPVFLDESTDAQSYSSNTSSVSCNPDVGLEDTASGGNEKVTLKDMEVLGRLSADKQAKINKFEDTIDDAEDLAENHLTASLEVTEAAPARASKASVKLYAKGTSWRHLAMGTSNDFEAARVAGLRQRKQVHIRSNSTGSSTMSETADEKRTKPVDDAQTLGVPAPSPGASNTRSRLNDSNSTARISVEGLNTQDPPRKSI